jgi:choline/ethanolamine kinase
LCSPEEAKEFRLDSLENEISALENNFSGDYHWVGFCHNDLQYGNVMIDEETNMLTIIVSFMHPQ